MSRSSCDEAGLSVVLSEDGLRATFTLNRPDRRNSQGPELWRSLLHSLHALPGTVRVLLLQSEGPFSAGPDDLHLESDGVLADTAAAKVEATSATSEGFQRAFSCFARPSIVSVALVQGHAVGAGFQLALACDIRIAASDAQFRMTEVGSGLVPDLGGTGRLVRLIGYSRALELCVAARDVGAWEAERIGLVNSVVGVDELHGAGAALAASLLAQPSSSVTEVKALLLAAMRNTQPEQELAERAAQYRLLRQRAGLIGEDDP